MHTTHRLPRVFPGRRHFHGSPPGLALALRHARAGGRRLRGGGRGALGRPSGAGRGQRSPVGLGQGAELGE